MVFFIDPQVNEFIIYSLHFKSFSGGNNNGPDIRLLHPEGVKYL
jgi:hypothetical protein